MSLFVVCLILVASGCDGSDDRREPPATTAQMVNFDHLDSLGEQAGPGNSARIIHIYSEAPSYGWVGDDDEGIACVDDAARAAVVYLRAFELTGDTAAREKGEELIRFILHMQTEDGLFYNFVWNNDLDINTTHQNSTAGEVEWWASRAIWALGVGARVLKSENPNLSNAAAMSIRRTLPHIEKLVENYPATEDHGGRLVPTWLVHETASDATSELLLGLSALERAYPDPKLAETIDKLAEGVAMAQWGSMNQFPYAAHGSWLEGWHGWGNSQTQALSEIGRTASAINEARSFYSRLLVNGWLHSFKYDNPDVSRKFEQIAYAVRAVSVGLIRLYESTGNQDYLIMAGLAASWFTGNNVAGFEMYDATTGRGHDGIGSPTVVNMNAGAESTIEALFTMLEIDQHPIASKWLFARGRGSVSETIDGKDYLHRLFVVADDSLAVVMNLTDEQLDILSGPELTNFLNR
jgi:hypothetical protein